MNGMHLCLWKTLSQDYPHGEIRHLCESKLSRSETTFFRLPEVGFKPLTLRLEDQHSIQTSMGKE